MKADPIFYLSDLTASEYCQRLGLKMQGPQTYSEDHCKDCIFLALSVGLRKALNFLKNKVIQIVT